jgi:hypothetical protein
LDVTWSATASYSLNKLGASNKIPIIQFSSENTTGLSKAFFGHPSSGKVGEALDALFQHFGWD